MKIITASIVSAAAVVLAGGARAEMCDYTPSSLVGKTATTIGTAVAGATTAAGVGPQAAGYYTLVHAGSGLTMLGSTAAGASAAGTIGIMAGTGGTVGAVVAFLMAPVTIIVGGITIVGVGAFEGACYFKVERVTDLEAVRKVIESVASQDEAVSIVRTDNGDAMVLKISGQSEIYLLRNLYIADGRLKHRDWGPNTDLGQVIFTSEITEE